MFPANTTVVVISGGKHTIPLVAAIAKEAQKIGGMVKMFPDLRWDLSMRDTVKVYVLP
jgi:hypothetical protein